MQNLPTFQKCTFGICELCGGFSHRGGVMGLVKDRSGQDVMPVRQVFICDPCLEQIGTSEVRLDGGEIKPGSIKPEDWLKIDEDGDFCLKGPIEIDTLDVQPVKPHFEGYDELAAKVEQLKLLRDIEKEVRLNAEVIERRFDEDPLLRAVYIPSAKRMVKMTGKAVDDLIGGLL